MDFLRVCLKNGRGDHEGVGDHTVADDRDVHAFAMNMGSKAAISARIEPGDGRLEMEIGPKILE
jgi:hypothetical protein